MSYVALQTLMEKSGVTADILKNVPEAKRAKALEELAETAGMKASVIQVAKWETELKTLLANPKLAKKSPRESSLRTSADSHQHKDRDVGMSPLDTDIQPQKRPSAISGSLRPNARDITNLSQDEQKLKM